MTFDEVRRRTIIALFSDDQLMDQIVLKGGNALSLIHEVSSRASLDLDFSLTRDFDDLEEAKTRIFRALKDRFDSVGYAVFDESLEPRPKLDGRYPSGEPIFH
ncbi:MAG TPA: nucleotidyl transferase AbiEii/AbiGii toxin family protein [Bryobacterales bacterium]|nr:nucleotidyl transferase AbiEii/AbiGii toxin family protein [Bryobacterales bacterium]